MSFKTKKTATALLPLFLVAIAISVATSSDLAIAETKENAPYAVDVKHFELNPIPKIHGSVDITKLIKSNIKTSFSDAAKTASQSVESGMVYSGSLTTVQGFSVYSFDVMDSKDMSYNIVIDAGNGKILHKSDAIQNPRVATQFSGIMDSWHMPNINQGQVFVKTFSTEIENP